MDDMTYDKGQKVRLQLDQMINTMETMQVGLPLVWLYVWDVIRSEYVSMSDDEYTQANPDFDLDDVWNALWNKPVFSLEFGPESLSEHVRDWLMTNDFIVDISEEG